MLKSAKIRWALGLLALAALLYALRPRGGGEALLGQPAGLQLSGPFLGSPGGQDAKLALGETGRVVVLDFWATWCLPCRKAIPEINALVEKFKDQPVSFISITDEDQATVQEFLQSQPMLSVVALDREGAMFRRFEITVIPTMVIIGRDGKVAKSLIPGNVVTAEQIQAQLDGA